MNLSDHIKALFNPLEDSVLWQEFDDVGNFFETEINILYDTKVITSAPSFPEIKSQLSDLNLFDSDFMGYDLIEQTCTVFDTTQAAALVYLNVPNVPPYPYVTGTIKTYLDANMPAIFLTQFGEAITTEMFLLHQAFENFFTDKYAVP